MADGFIPLPREDRADGFAPTFLIAALDAARREAATAPAPRDCPDPTAALIEEARIAGYAEGHAAGHAEGLRAALEDRDARAVQAATMAAEALRAARTEAAAAAQQVATGLARVALAVLDAALPGMAAAQAPALAAAFAGRLAPVLEAEPQACLRVAPGLAAATAALLPTGGIVVEEDAALAPGDARAEWRAGGARLDLAARRREIRRVLHAAGLAEEDD